MPGFRFCQVRRLTRVRLDLVVKLGLHPRGVDGEWLTGTRGKRRVTDHNPVECQRCGHAVDLKLVQSPTRALQGVLTGVASDDQLGEQRVEVAADDIAHLEATVQAHTGTGRRPKHRERAGGGQKTAPRVFAVDPELEGVTAQFGVVKAEFFAVGNAELLSHQV